MPAVAGGTCQPISDYKGRQHFLDATDLVSNHFCFVFIDPYGPTPTLFSIVRKVVRGQYTDTLINFPFYSLQKWSGYLFKENPTDQELSRLAAADAFMGGSEWRDVFKKEGVPRGSAEERLIELYVDNLSKEGVFSLALPLYFEDRNRIMYHLVFTTHNIAGLAAAKKQFVDARDHQIRLREDARFRRTKQGAFGFMADSAGTEIEVEDVAEMLANEFLGKKVAVEQVVLRGLGESDILESDVKKALSLLKREGRARYSRNRYKDFIDFMS